MTISEARLKEIWLWTRGEQLDADGPSEEEVSVILTALEVAERRARQAEEELESYRPILDDKLQATYPIRFRRWARVNPNRSRKETPATYTARSMAQSLRMSSVEGRHQAVVVEVVQFEVRRMSSTQWLKWYAEHRDNQKKSKPEPLAPAGQGRLL
jgi:hypothetical protein